MPHQHQPDEQGRHIPTDEEEALARAIDERVVVLRRIAHLANESVFALGEAIAKVAVLNGELLTGRLVLGNDGDFRAALSWGTAVVGDLGGETLASIKGVAVSGEQMAQGFERIAVSIREYGRCERCGNFHPPAQHEVVDLREHLQGGGDLFRDLFKRGDNSPGLS